MRILVTGGTGVVGTGTVTELLRRDHTVVLLSRHARHDAQQWPDGVTPRDADVSNAASLRGVADGCDAVLHMAAVVDETPPDITFDNVNVCGTANMIAEAERAHVPRFVYVSSLGAPTGASAYHRSKHRAEELVRWFHGEWTICRPGNVYGPGDEQISLLLRIARGVSPIIPKVGDGTQPFQPIWWEDIAHALADVVERDDMDGCELDLAGNEVTCQNDLIERLSVITGRDLHSIALPEVIATLGAQAVSLVGWDVSFNESQIQMLREGNVVPEASGNALTNVLGIEPTRLDTGLRALAGLQPEQLPSEGVGTLKRKKFWAEITGSTMDAAGLFEEFRTHFNDVTPVFVDVGTEPDADDVIADGRTLTLSLPLRGHVQVRVAELERCSVTLLALKGHPLAGAVRFQASAIGTSLGFQLEVFDRASNLLDLVAMRTIGDFLQNHTWTQVVDKMIARSGGTSERGVEHNVTSVSNEEGDRIDAWLESIALEQQRQRIAERIADKGDTAATAT